VKHFKHERRGKRRIHKKPDTSEIGACRWWLDHELAIVQPRVSVALGATAVRALIRKALTINANRGRLIALRGGRQGVITILPAPAPGGTRQAARVRSPGQGFALRGRGRQEVTHPLNLGVGELGDYEGRTHLIKNSPTAGPKWTTRQDHDKPESLEIDRIVLPDFSVNISSQRRGRNCATGRTTTARNCY
jgi:hypothetical protein